jgi:hypothetical protein
MKRPRACFAGARLDQRIGDYERQPKSPRSFDDIHPATKERCVITPPSIRRIAPEAVALIALIVVKPVELGHTLGNGVHNSKEIKEDEV